MHNLFLGELKHHCREVWHMNIKEKKEKKIKPHSYDRQVQEFGKAVRAIQNSLPKFLENLRKGYIVAIATENKVEVTTSARTQKDYISAVLEWVTADPKLTIRIPNLKSDPKDGDEDNELDHVDHSIQQIITSDMLREIQNDINATTFPSWLERPPRHIGSPSHGKLKADEWRTVCTVNLVITLVWLWGPGNEWENSLLGNFLDLVIAVEYASKRRMNPERVQVYSQHIVRYLHSLWTLFPKHKFTPNHHLSFHLSDCLRLFGPVHSWWSFPFECYNGVISRFNKNYKPSEMEITFLETFCRGSNLRALLPRLSFSSLLYQDLIRDLQNMFLPWGRQGTLVSDVLSFTTTASHGHDAPSPTERILGRFALQEDEYDHLLKRINQDCPDRPYAHYHAMIDNDLVLPCEAQFVRRIQIGACIYNSSKSTNGFGNSFVIFRRPGEHFYRAGQIQRIFLHRRLDPDQSDPRSDGSLVLEPFLDVAEYTPLLPDHWKHNLYAKVPYLNTWLCYNRFKDIHHTIRTTDLISHFASYVYNPKEIGLECIVVRSLDR
ncbi:hypothetical protein BDN72DRAFT_741616, partial [Pluteus cervinus]